MSRSTWACELKWRRQRASNGYARVTLHVSVWVEILVLVCSFLLLYRHAPRERVSWNLGFSPPTFDVVVTLHVSVWVEICRKNGQRSIYCVTLHVSVWVEIHERTRVYNVNKSRSTWACELKLLRLKRIFNTWCHAPRERVSWNNAFEVFNKAWQRHAPRERVSWNLCFFLR